MKITKYDINQYLFENNPEKLGESELIFGNLKEKGYITADDLLSDYAQLKNAVELDDISGTILD